MPEHHLTCAPKTVATASSPTLHSVTEWGGVCSPHTHRHPLERRRTRATRIPHCQLRIILTMRRTITRCHCTNRAATAAALAVNRLQVIRPTSCQEGRSAHVPAGSVLYTWSTTTGPYTVEDCSILNWFQCLKLLGPERNVIFSFCFAHLAARIRNATVTCSNNR